MKSSPATPTPASTITHTTAHTQITPKFEIEQRASELSNKPQTKVYKFAGEKIMYVWILARALFFIIPMITQGY